MIQIIQLINDSRQVSQAVGHTLCAVDLDSSPAAEGSHLRADGELLHHLRHRGFCIAGSLCRSYIIQDETLVKYE